MSLYQRVITIDNYRTDGLHMTITITITTTDRSLSPCDIYIYGSFHRGTQIYCSSILGGSLLSPRLQIFAGAACLRAAQPFPRRSCAFGAAENQSLYDLDDLIYI